MNKKISPKSGTEKTVLEVVSVSACSGRSNGNTSDSEAIEILQNAGFVSLKLVANRMTAHSPGGDTLFLLEYDGASPANQKPCQLVHLGPDVCKEIETGYTLYIQSMPGVSGSIEISLKGNRLLDWVLICKPANPNSILEYRIKVARSILEARRS